MSAKERYPEEIAGIIANELSEADLDTRIAGILTSFAKAFDPEEAITQMLENNVGVLDNLRQTAALANQRNKAEMRLHGHPASALLTGYEEPIDYYQLVAIINTMKAGIARRRVAALA